MRERINGVVPVETKVNAKAAKSTHLVIMFLRNLIWVFIKLIVLEVKLIISKCKQYVYFKGS